MKIPVNERLIELNCAKSQRPTVLQNMKLKTNLNKRGLKMEFKIEFSYISVCPQFIMQCDFLDK